MRLPIGRLALPFRHLAGPWGPHYGCDNPGLVAALGVDTIFSTPPKSFQASPGGRKCSCRGRKKEARRVEASGNRSGCGVNMESPVLVLLLLLFFFFIMSGEDSQHACNNTKGTLDRTTVNRIFFEIFVLENLF